MADPETLAQAFAGETVITADADGHAWAGTVYWLVRDPIHQRRDAGRAIDGMIALERPNTLTPYLIDGAEARIDINGHLARVFVRPDGQHVHVRDDYLLAIEAMLIEEDEYGSDVAIRTRLMQGPTPRHPIGVETDDGHAELLALVMPIRVTR